jgi:uncharacterized membrane protein YidH (DUF202 family)
VSAIPERANLQPERTALAWQRTAITALVILLPSIAVSLRLGERLIAIGGAFATMLSGALVLAVRRRFVQLLDDTRGYSPYPPMVQVAAVTAMGGLGGAAVGLAVFLH